MKPGVALGSPSRIQHEFLKQIRLEQFFDREVSRGDLRSEEFLDSSWVFLKLFLGALLILIGRPGVALGGSG